MGGGGGGHLLVVTIICTYRTAVVVNIFPSVVPLLTPKAQ